ncbi:MAG: FTR1 family protein [Rickettsiales bacterium]
MYQSFIIIFREILEIAIILSVVVAATQNIKKRNTHILFGILAGIIGASIIAIFTGKISNALDGAGQEITNALTLLFASGFIGWTVIWMKKHGRQLSSTIKQKGKEVQAGEASLLSISTIVALSIFREGSEVVLFTYSILATTKDSVLQIIAGAGAGLFAGTLTGILFYLGIIQFSGKHLFNVTAILLSFISASMASQAGMFLQAAGYIDFINAQPIWNSSFLLSDSSVFGNVASVIFGYTSQPTIIEITFYLLTLLIIAGSAKATSK